MATNEVESNSCPTKPDDAIEECDKRYERMDKLGEGTYGLVYRAKDKLTNEVRLFRFTTLLHFRSFAFIIHKNS